MRPNRALHEGRELVQLEFRIAVAWAELMQAPAGRQAAVRTKLSALEAQRQVLRHGASAKAES